MAIVQEMPPRTDRTRADDQPKGLPPVKTFFALLGIIGAMTVLALWQSNGDLKGSSSARSGGGQTAQAKLSDAKAMSHFRALRNLWVRTYRDRDLSLVPLYVAPDAVSPFSRISSEISRLRADGVLDETRLRIRQLQLLTNSEDVVRIRERVAQMPRFVDEESGQDLTLHREPRVLTVIWTMRRYSEGWRLYRSHIIAVRKMRKS